MESIVLYCPVDHYDAPESIAVDATTLGWYARVILHCERLRPYFAPYAPLEYLDHHVKFAARPRTRFRNDGPILWVGVRSNLPPLAAWVNDHPPPGQLVVLSNFEDANHLPDPADLGFGSGLDVRLEQWSQERQVELTAACRAALDIKGDDFRSRHKPPVKAVDFLASGVPFAINPGSSPAEYLAGLDFEVASPLDVDRWLSREYWEECRRIGRTLRQRLTRSKVAARLLRIIDRVVKERAARKRSTSPNAIPKVALPPAESTPSGPESLSVCETDLRVLYANAGELAVNGRHGEAQAALERVESATDDDKLRALAVNDLAVLTATQGDVAAALTGFRRALAIDPACDPARHNLALLEVGPEAESPCFAKAPVPNAPLPVRVTVVSFLFNWPSTGGGIVHTAELCRFLGEAGYDVRHVYARFDPWEIGRVAGPLPFPSECLAFAEPDWNLPTILDRFRRAVDTFDPDYVIVTDSWNVKPLLADAFRGRRVILRLQAMECLCPLNGVRLLPGPGGQARQCPRHQLATPDACRACLSEFGGTSGGLHRAERALCGVGTPEYDVVLRRAFHEAEAVLVVNPLTESLVGPYANNVKVVTAGMDPARFPWSGLDDPAEPPSGRQLRLLFAGLTVEWMKGFHVLHDACALLWRTRQDFELLATADPPGPVDAFTRNVGWLSQDELPRQIRSADILVMPTIAQEGLGRTAVEAMACGRPVVASRIGGLTATVLDGATGLLFGPGDATDLARKLAELLDDPELRRRMGEAGRRRFEEHYSWPVIIEKHYRPLLVPSAGGKPPAAPTVLASPREFAPIIHTRVDQAKLQDDVAEFLGLTASRVMGLYRGYRALHDRERYAERLGEFKTLCFEEAFVLYAVMTVRRPASLVEVGTQHGKSARRLLDMRNALGLDAPLTCFDVDDRLEHAGRHELDLTIRDVTGRFRADVLDARPPGLVFLDVHAYSLLREAVAEILADRQGWVLAVHDCGRGLCNPRMAITKDDPDVTSSTGVWERHVLAEAFGVADPLDPALDATETATHRLRIFDTLHGLGLIVAKPNGANRGS